METPELERLARALQAEGAAYERPIELYVRGEAAARWNAANPGLDFYIDGPGASPDGWEDWAFMARAVLTELIAMAGDTPDMVEAAAVAMWVEEARRAAPNVAKYRTAETFREQPDQDIEAWLGLARAAIPAMIRHVLREGGGEACAA